MKRVLSFVLSVCVLMMSGTFTALAEETDTNEVILSVNDAVWTLPDDLKTITTTDYGDSVPKCVVVKNDTNNSEAPLAELGTNTYVTYSNIPSGVYKVEYFYPTFAGTTAVTGRNSQILDQDIEINDANGTHTVKSTKPSVTYGGWVEIGTYEFGNTGNSIKVTVNQDNKIFRARWDRRFVSSQIKLTPVTENHSALLSAVNTASTASEMKTAVNNNANGFVNASALKYMGDVYQTLFTNRPATGFASAYAFKTAFDSAVEQKLTKQDVTSTSLVWQNTDSNVTASGYRINWSPVEIGNASTLQPRAIVTFKLDNVQNLKSMSLKLNANSDNDFQLPVKITKYSSSIITLPNASKEQNKQMMANATFTDLQTAIPIGVAKKEISDEAIIAAAKTNGYISFYIEPDAIDCSEMSLTTKLSLEAKLNAVYDNTSDPTMSVTAASANSAAANTSKVFDISGFDTVAGVTVNNVAVDANKYFVKDNRLKINGDVFANAGNYTVSVSNGSESRDAIIEVKADTVLAQRTLNGSATTYTLNANEWNIAGTTIDAWSYGTGNTADNTYVTYSNIPNGAYDVYYTVPTFKSASIPQKRNLSILDTGVTVKDITGETITKSVKTSVSGGGDVYIGTYEFDDTNKEIKVYVNDEHACIYDGQYGKLFVPGGLTLKPAASEELTNYYFENGKTYIDAIKAATTETGLETVVSSNSFVDAKALKNMTDVYAALLKQKYSSAYKFKKSFDEEVEKKVTTKTYEATILSQNQANSIRALSANQLLHKDYYLVTAFKDVDKDNVLSAEVKLNVNAIRADAVINGCSYKKYERTSNDELTNGNFETANEFVNGFTALTTPVAVVSADTAQIPSEMFDSITDDKYISFKFGLGGAILSEQSRITSNEYTSKATLTVRYDNTVLNKTAAAKKIADAATLETAKGLAKTYSELLNLESDKTDVAAVALWKETISSETDVTTLLAKIGTKEVVLAKADYANKTVTVTVKNLSDAEQDIRIISATYASERMEEVELDETNTKIAPVSVITTTLTFDSDEFDVLKVFAFDSLTNIKPYDNALIISK